MSTDPRCLILLCGGHFGLTLCQVTREFKAVAGHEGSLWVAHEPQMQQVQLGHKGGYGREAKVEADVLCVRFSTQTNSLENVYVTDSRGHIMLFQIRYDASVGVSASRVRTYAGSELLGVAIFGLEIVTAQLLEGKRISSVQLSMADDWALLFSRDHVIRLVSLQRGVLKQLVPPAVPQVRLAGPLMDVVWSERHHFVACCAMDEHALPLLAFVGEDAKDVQRPPKEGTKDPTTAHSPDLQSTLAISGISPSIDSDYRRWADHWINGNENARSAITMEEKKRMKEPSSGI
eukprot:g27282.t2